MPDLESLTFLLDIASLNRCRLIVCVDDDIDIHDGRQILWALATRFQPSDDSIIRDNDGRQILWALATRFQPSDDSIIRDGKMIIDARKGDDWIAKRATLPSSIHHTD
jgi:3-polyprenyl-4-hydroxybenzoate decarboxylase